MTSNSNNPSSAPLDLAELKRLFAELSDGQLQLADRDRLEQLLLTHREARRMYMAYMQIDAGLDWKVRGGQSVHGLTDMSFERAVAAASANGHWPRDGAGKIGRRMIYVAAALAASIAIVFASALWTSSDRKQDLIAADPKLPTVDDSGAASASKAVAKVVELSDECRWFVENRRNGDGVVVVGDKVRLTRGQLRMEFACGATVTMKSPAALDIISPMRTRAVLGTLKAHVDKGAEGFTVETPRTTVVDLGTDFGIDVTDYGSTDVVVFTGTVDVHSDGVEGLKSRQRLRAGEGVRVSGEGTASRIVSIDDSRFSIAGAGTLLQRTPVISAVNDNILRGESWCFYEIVHGGMREDAKAFVDREHEWNGIEVGMPYYLLGADYVKTFNDDKLNRKVEIRVTIERPAILYVLLDKRSPPPDWLREKFFKTGDEVGLDGGGYRRFGLGSVKTIDVGAGGSIDDKFSIWRLDVPKAGTVKLGAMHVGSPYHNMYAIAAVPLSMHDGHDDFPGSLDAFAGSATPLSPNQNGDQLIDGAIETPSDTDTFTFNWRGGIVEVACQTSGFTTLDPILRVYDANRSLVGFAQANPAGRERVAVTMNLPPGAYSVEVMGSDDVGEVGAYHVRVGPTSGQVPLTLPQSPSLFLRATPTATGTDFSWNALPDARSYTIERSRDAVKFEPVVTIDGTSATDAAIAADETYVYRLRADIESGQIAGEPIAVRARAPAVDHVDTFGLSSRTIVLGWSDAVNGEGYRIERSTDGEQFETIGTAPRHANGYRDSVVEPGRQYFYRVATLNGAGGDALSNPVQALSGVPDVAVAAVAGNRVELTWTSSFPRARYYVKRAVGSSDDFVTVGAVEGNGQHYVDATAVPGRKHRYRIVAVEDVFNLKHVKEGALDTIRLPDGCEDDDFFGLRITGNIRVENSGSYTFFLNSDDGGKLLLNGDIVVDNDGRHAPQYVAGTVWLAAGNHDLEVQYFQIDGRRELDLSWNGPGTQHPNIGHFRLPDPYLSGLTYRYYEGNWEWMPFKNVTAVSPIVTARTPSTTDGQSK